MTAAWRPNRQDERLALVHAKLRGPVTELYQQMVPGLGGVPRDRAFDMVMGSPQLLDGCFKLFRARRDRFGPLLLDQRGQVTAADDVPLACGKTVDEIITLVVRAAARRYFRAHVPDRAAPLAVTRPVRRSGAVEWLNQLLGRAPTHAVTRRKSRAERLYAALKQFLRYEWQALLIPHYARLTAKTARALGARLLELRDPDSLDRAVADLTGGRSPVPAVLPPSVAAPLAQAILAEAAAAPPLPPSAAEAPVPAVASSGGRPAVLQGEWLWQTMQQQQIGPLLGVEDEARQRLLVAYASSVGKASVDCFFENMVEIPTIVAMLCALVDGLGPRRFGILMGEPGDAAALKLLGATLAQLPLGQGPGRIKAAVAAARTMARTLDEMPETRGR